MTNFLVILNLILFIVVLWIVVDLLIELFLGVRRNKKSWIVNVVVLIVCIISLIVGIDGLVKTDVRDVNNFKNVITETATVRYFDGYTLELDNETYSAKTIDNLELECDFTQLKTGDIIVYKQSKGVFHSIIFEFEKLELK